MATDAEMLIHLVRRGMAQGIEVKGARTTWLIDQPSPFGGDGYDPDYSRIVATDLDNMPEIADFSYEARLVTGKKGPVGSISLVALVKQAEGVSRQDAFRHWDEHIPLALEIHHKAVSYKQYRLLRSITQGAPDYFGLAILSFASPEDVLTGIYRSKEDEKIIADDVAEFISSAEVMFGTEQS